ncbi:hypothetical protein HYS93_04085 [Candidatus Daviesbacteria bacterium]|nr:hypothetical protein [Candidatus Daviesbacteria bacterium]
MTVELRAQTTECDLSKLSPKELIELGVKTKRFEIVPVKRILTENAIIDTDHARGLGESMALERGQISPVALRVRLSEEDGEPLFDVIDGFHRVEGKRMDGKLDSDIEASVLYGCDDEEMFALRVLAVSSVKAVQYPRLADWILKMWEASKFSKLGLTVAQAFSIAINDTQNPVTVRMTPELVIELKGWVLKYCTDWQKSPPYIFNILKTVENADPDLVRLVRTASGGKDRAAKITPARLKVVVDHFPGEENYSSQRAILRVAANFRLSSVETTELVTEIAQLLEPGMPEDAVYDLANKIAEKHERIRSSIQTHTTSNGSVDELDEAEIISEIEQEYLEPSDRVLDQIENMLIAESPHRDDGFIPPRTAKASKIAPRVMAAVSHEAGLMDGGTLARGEAKDLDYLKARIEDLERAVETANSPEGVSSDTWWRAAPYLTPIERVCMERIIYGNQELDRVARDLKITPLTAIAQIRSAFARRVLAQPEIAVVPLPTNDRLLLSSILLDYVGILLKDSPEDQF